MILITGAAGKTGKAILQALSSHSEPVRVIVHNMQQADALLALGADDVKDGDLRDELTLTKSVEGIDKVYYICPNMTPDEAVIGQKLLTLAIQAGVKRFVYHSVLHPQIKAMPHHWQKLTMEEQIFSSGIDFTILQPCAYMQNLLGSWISIQQQGIFPIPYRTSARISIVDLKDVAEVAAKVLTEDGHKNAIYELSGPKSLSQDEVADILCTQLQKPVVAKEIDRAGWSEHARSSGLGEFEINTLLMMFEYYEKFGFQGNTKILEYLLNRPATSLDIFISRQLALETNIKP